MLKIDDVSIYADGLDHPECVVWHPDGSVWAGGEAGQIYRIGEQGSVEEVANTGGFVLGMALSPDQTWMAICDLKKKCVWRLDMKSMKLTVFADNVPGHKISIPNYCCFDSTGNFYLSESGKFGAVNGKILKFDREGKGSVWHEGPFNFANGLALGHNEKCLYVVCTFAHCVEKIEIREDGLPGKREIYASFDRVIPDGIAVCATGDLLVSCYAPNAIIKVSPDRVVTRLIDDWEAHTLCNPTNIAFGGKDLARLFVANLGRWHIAVVESDTRGLALPCQRNNQSWPPVWKKPDKR